MSNLWIHWVFAFLLSFISAQETLFCYYTSWARYRPFPGNYSMLNIEPDLCSHVVYAFADITDGTIQFGDDGDPVMYRQLQALKLQNPSLRTLLSIGGFTAGSEPFSKITADETSRLKFATSAIEHLRTHDFDGLDIDWEYPLRMEGGKEAFSNLIMYLRTVFETEAAMQRRPRLLLTAALAGGEWAVDASYNIPLLAKYLDYALLLTYDFHGSWENRTGLHSAFAGRDPSDNLNLQWVVNKYHVSGMPKNKIVLGIGTFGRSWSLSDPGDNGVGAPASGPGAKGEYTQEMGILSYNEICVRLQLPGWINMTDPIQMVPFAIHEDQWIGYEDPSSAELKANYIKAQGLAGAMFWSLPMDDFQGICSLGHTYPIIRSVKRVFDSLNAAAQAATLANIIAGMRQMNAVTAMTNLGPGAAIPLVENQPESPNTGQFPEAPQNNEIVQQNVDEEATSRGGSMPLPDAATGTGLNPLIGPTAAAQLVAAANARTIMTGILPDNTRNDVPPPTSGVPQPVPVFIEQVQSATGLNEPVENPIQTPPSAAAESTTGQENEPQNFKELKQMDEIGQDGPAGSPLESASDEGPTGQQPPVENRNFANGAVLGFAPLGTSSNNGPRQMIQGRLPFFPFRPMPYVEYRQGNPRHGFIAQSGVRYEPGQPPKPRGPPHLSQGVGRDLRRRPVPPGHQHSRILPFRGTLGKSRPHSDATAKEGREGVNEQPTRGLDRRRKFGRGKKRRNQGEKKDSSQEFKYKETVYNNLPTTTVRRMS